MEEQSKNNKKIFFVKDISKLKLNIIKNNTLLVYYEGYDLPKIENIKYMKFNEYKNIYSEIEIEMLIIVGLNRIINPSNRCEMVHEYMQTMTPNIEKISIDNHPFIGEPWRLWYHYNITKSDTFNISYSYTLETEWQHWFYKDVDDCRLSGKNIKNYINNTYSDLDILISNFVFYEPNEIEKSHYEEIKKFVFEKYNTPKLLINNLLKLSNKYFNLDFDYDSYRENKIFNIPNLGVYRFMVEENKRRLDIYNQVII